MNSSDNPSGKRAVTGPVSWIITAVAVVAVFAVTRYIQHATKVDITIDSGSMRAPKLDENVVLTYTRRLVDQKVKSLERYNKERPVSELLAFFESQTQKSVTEEAFKELSRQMTDNVIPLLWQRCGQDVDGPPILHEHMHRWIQYEFPHETLTNADVVFYPEVEDLRIVVSEPNTDYFRDSAWHWRWIGQFSNEMGEVADDLSPEEIPLELDVYAAEELSEFLSVLAVAVVEIAARDSDSPTVAANEIKDVFKRLKRDRPELAGDSGERRLFQRFRFSADAKKELLNNLPNPMFRDATSETGIDFVHRMSESNSKKRTEVETTVGFGGGGVSINDYDGDGDQDVYFAGDQCGALFDNENGKFTNVSEQAGIPQEGESRAGFFVDFDNDGDNDLFITRVGLPNLLLQNDGQGNFQDVAPDVGLANNNFISHEAVWCDINNDGLLDVYVANFGNWLDGDKPTIGRVNSNAAPNELFLQRIDNDGNRTFEEVAARVGVDDRGWTHCVGAYDFDRDGWMDLFSLNDFGASMLYRNVEGKGFEEMSSKMHIDDVYNAMNFTLMDLDHDGDLSAYISQIIKLVHRQRYKRPTEQTQVIFNPKIVQNMRIIVANCLIKTNSDHTRFRDEHNLLIEPADLGWSWGITAYDFENDSDTDMIVVNGTEPKTSQWQGTETFVSMFSDEQNVCYAQQDGYFYDVSSINPIAFKGNSRCAMTMDFDADGDQDIFLANYDSAARVYENLQQDNNHWIRLKLIGTKSNRNAIGARVELRFGDEKRFGQVVSRSGFLSQSSYQLHFGLGQQEVVDEVNIHWPSGVVQSVKSLTAGKLHEIREAP